MMYHIFILINPIILKGVGSMMTLNEMGMNFRHGKDFEINRPHGSGDNLLIVFKSSAVIELDGKTEKVLPDSAVLFSVGAPQIYRADGGIYVNHWIHMDCCEKDVFHESTGLTFNKIIRLANSAEAEDIMHMMSREELSDLPSKNKYMDLLIKMLLLKLGDCGRNAPAIAANHHYSELRQLRAEIYSSPGQYTSIDRIAVKVNLSPPHFQRLYKEQFGVSCYEDLLSAKTKAAQYYLKNTNMTVKEIASVCGYENDVCFMRRFKQRTGLTPTEYRAGY